MIVRGSSRASGHFLRALLFLLVAAVDLGAQDRMPPIPVDKMTKAQREAVAKSFPPGTTGPISGPYASFLRSPEVLVGRKIVGDYLLGYKGVLPPNLTEMAILMTARQWTQQFIWNAHSQLATKAGVKPHIIQAIGEGRRPAAMTDDEATIYDFCDELYRNRSISDATYARALTKLGEQGIVEAVATMGHWASNAMMMNTVRVPLPAGATAPLAPFPR
jgi:4-carboxymuconolactone decarboxylase